MRIPRLLLACSLAAGVLAAIPAVSQAAPTHYYLSLGDSLSVGYQPGLGDTNQGFSDDVFTALHNKDSSLVLVKLGCSGETTTTMINGGQCKMKQNPADPGNPNDLVPYYPVTGTQLGDALAFITAHKADVKYLTIDIGANDVDRCAPGGSIDAVCIAQGEKTIAQNLNTILAALKKADGNLPQSEGMAYYDPFLQYWLTGPTGQAVATASVTALAGINLTESTVYTSYGFKVADVFTKFKSAQFVPLVNTPPYGKIPTNVSKICTWTYMCVVQNIHPKPIGYQQIADAFLAKLT